ncbi:MAG TPA: redoxin domain-containing protein [Sulfurivirga caldicuralii]|nr:redoxin domain-containing protein [Sulfurivirga caldicuralii]
MKSFLKRNLPWLLLFVLLWSGIRFWQQADMAEGPLPVHSLPTLAGTTLDLTALDKPLLLHFTASWCPICQLQHGTMQALSQRWTVVQIITQSGDRPAMIAYAEEHGIPLDRAIPDPDGQILKIFGANAVPADFFVGHDNSISFHEMGYTTRLGYEIRLMLSR